MFHVNVEAANGRKGRTEGEGGEEEAEVLRVEPGEEEEELEEEGSVEGRRERERSFFTDQKKGELKREGFHWNNIGTIPQERGRERETFVCLWICHMLSLQTDCTRFGTASLSCR